MTETFPVECDFALRWAKTARPEHFQVYIYLLCLFHRAGTLPSKAEVARALPLLSEGIVEGAFDFWEAVGLLSSDGRGGFTLADIQLSSSAQPAKGAAAAQSGKVTVEGLHKRNPDMAVLQTRPKYSGDELSQITSENEGFAFLVKQAQIILGKPLRSTDVEILYSFCDWFGLPVEVVIMLLQYAAGKNKRAMRYIEQIAIDWSDKGITTFDAAERHVKQLEKRDSREWKIKAVLGIGDRALTESEKKYIGYWAGELNVPLELVPAAYERTVAGTGKLSMAYMDKILKNWKDTGIRTLEKLKQADEEHAVKKAAAPSISPGASAARSKFNNFTNERQVDYSALRRGGEHK